MNQRALAAKQILINQVRKSPLVQAVQQRSLNPYKKALGRALEPGNLMPMGSFSARAAKVLQPRAMQAGINAFNNDAAQFRAMKHLDSAEATAQRMKQAFAEKNRQDMIRAFAGFLTRKF